MKMPLVVLTMVLTFSTYSMADDKKGMGKMMDEEMMEGMGEMMGGGMMGGESGEKGPMAQEKAAGEVTIIATFQNPEAANGKDDLRFEVKLDTHTVDLDRYDFKKRVVLKDDRGKSYNPAKVDLEGSGHHRSAVISFKNPGKVKELKLLVKELAGVKETAFEWEINKDMMGQ